MKIAIFGAAGAIGRALLPELLRQGHEVRLVGRDRDKLTPFAPPEVDIVTADLADPVQARQAAAGVDAVVFAVGLPYHQSAGYPALTQTAVDAARAAGVGRFVLISTVYSYGRARTVRVAETHPREPHTVKGRNRKLQADIVLGAHDPTGLQTLVLVLPDFYGPTADLSYAKEIFDAVGTGKTANVIGPLDVAHEYVYVPDAVAAVAALLVHPEAFGRAYNLGGAGTITTRDFIGTVERLTGKRIKKLVVNKTMLRLLGTFNPLLREMVEMHYLFTEPVVLDDTRLHSILPDLRKTPYAAGIAATLAATRTPREPVYV